MKTHSFSFQLVLCLMASMLGERILRAAAWDVYVTPRSYPPQPPPEVFEFRHLADFGGPGCGIYGVTGVLLEGPGERLWGTASGERTPTLNRGVIFSINKDGTGCRIEHDFLGAGANDGAQPRAGLIDGLDGYFYGTTLVEGSLAGGGGASGSVFRIRSDGTGYQVIHTFKGLNGSQPYARLLRGPDGAFWGTTSGGGSFGGGVVFRLEEDPGAPSGWAYDVMHEFRDAGVGPPNEAHEPHAGLEDGNDGWMYGTLNIGGPSHASLNGGAVFRINTSGSFELIFTPAVIPGVTGGTEPVSRFGSGLTFAHDGAFYGFSLGSSTPSSYGAFFVTAFEGGVWRTRNLHDIFNTAGVVAIYQPEWGMRMIEGPDGRLYGTGTGGFGGAHGGVFVTTRDGSDFKTAVGFLNAAPVPGGVPRAGLLAASDGWFYGTTTVGGANGWGTLFSFRPNNVHLGVGADVVSVTQGADFDASTPGAAPVRYELIRRKDTLVRIQAYTLGLPSRISTALLEVKHVGGRPPWVFSADRIPREPVAGHPAGGFSGAPTLDFWLNGDAFDEGGDYVFTLIAGLAGEPGLLNRVRLGTYHFVGTRQHLAVLVFPGGDSSLATPAMANAIPWSTQHAQAVLDTLGELGRMFPLMRGSIRFSPSATVDVGVRWKFGAPYHPATAVEDRALWRAGFQRHMADALVRENAAINRLGIRDQFDLALGMEATRTNLTASCLRISPGRPGAARTGVVLSDFGNRQRTTTPTLLLREVARCFGAIDSPGGRLILPNGRKVVNVQTRADVPFPAILNGAAANVSFPIAQTFLSGAAWNAVRLEFSRLHSSLSGAARPAVALSPASFFHFSGILNQNGTVVQASSQMSESALGPLTEPVAASPWQLVFLGPGDAQLAVTPFNAEYGEGGLAVVLLEAEIPNGTTRVQVLHDTAVAWTKSVTAQAPVVSGVTVEDIGAGQRKAVWTASDPDGDPLLYTVLVRGTNNDAPQLLATSVSATEFIFDSLLMPAGPAAITIEATDGFNVGSADSAPFTISNSPPMVAITGKPSRSVLSSQSVLLEGLAYSTTEGMLPDAALRWFEGDVLLGTGTRLEQQFSPGPHTIRLVAATAAGLSGNDEVSLHVSADTDADGVADDYEAAHGLVVGRQDGGSDADGDGLTGREESILGTDPGNADSDGDTFTDGDERRLASDPADLMSVPLPELLLLSTNEIAFGNCPATMKQLTLTTPTPQTTWSATTTIPGLSLNPSNGTGSGVLQFTLDCAGMDPGNYSGAVWLNTPGGRAMPVLITASVPGGEPTPPPVTIEPMPDLTLDCDGSGFAVGLFTPRVAIGSGIAALVESDPPSGTRFALGTNSVTVNATTATTTNQLTFNVIVKPAVAPLTIRLDSGEAVISWSVACGESILESSADLSSPSSWGQVLAASTRDGDIITVRLGLEPASAAGFFRLRQP